MLLDQHVAPVSMSEAAWTHFVTLLLRAYLQACVACKRKREAWRPFVVITRQNLPKLQFPAQHSIFIESIPLHHFLFIHSIIIEKQHFTRPEL
jgi:hypothetical protein